MTKYLWQRGSRRPDVLYVFCEGKKKLYESWAGRPGTWSSSQTSEFFDGMRSGYNALNRIYFPALILEILPR